MKFRLVPNKAYGAPFHNAENGFYEIMGKVLRGHRELVIVIGHAATISAGEWITASGALEYHEVVAGVSS